MLSMKRLLVPATVLAGMLLPASFTQPLAPEVYTQGNESF